MAIKFGRFFANTDGMGYWSRHKRCVKAKRIEFIYGGLSSTSNQRYGELRVFFTKSSWHPPKHNLIYTDDSWLKGLRQHLAQFDIDGDDVNYSEQGMQGYDYVSLDVFGNDTCEKLMKLC